ARLLQAHDELFRGTGAVADGEDAHAQRIAAFLEGGVSLSVGTTPYESQSVIPAPSAIANAVVTPAHNRVSRRPRSKTARDLRIAQAGVSANAMIASESPSTAPRTSDSAIGRSFSVSPLERGPRCKRPANQRRLTGLHQAASPIADSPPLQGFCKLAATDRYGAARQAYNRR